MSSHASAEGASPDIPFRGTWEWWFVLFAALIAAGCGAYGLWDYEIKYQGRADWLSVGYHTLQLFILHGPHLEHEVTWPLHAGRWLAALVFLYAVIKGVMLAFPAEWRLFSTRWRSGHVVVCGLGRLGMQLAREFRRSGQRVVAIEARGFAEQAAIARDLGVALLTGDACNSGDLQRAAVARARQVIAVCDDEQTNVAVAAAIGELLGKGAHRRNSLGALECWMFVPDARLRQVFQQHKLFPNTGPNYRVNVRGLDLFELAARQAFARSPLDFERIAPEDSTVVHLVILGFGSTGQHLALQAAQLGHFANFQKVKLTVVERQGSTRPQAFLARYPKFNDICDVKLANVPIEAPDAIAQLAVLTPRRAGLKELATVAVCWDTQSDRVSGESDLFRRLEQDDPTNLSLALDLSRIAANGKTRLLVFQTRQCGFGALFPAEGRGEAIGARLHAFGMLEETCSLETILHERQDAIARALHNDYCDNQKKEGKVPGSKPALYPWEQLADRFKDSNRQAADHIPVKLRAIGYRVDALRRDQPRLTTLDHKDHAELLAKMEHARWCAEMWLQGYSYAPGKQNEIDRTHPCLLPWDKLDEGTKKWDRDQVRAIPEALKHAGYGIYPQTQ